MQTVLRGSVAGKWMAALLTALLTVAVGCGGGSSSSQDGETPMRGTDAGGGGNTADAKKDVAGEAGTGGAGTGGAGTGGAPTDAPVDLPAGDTPKADAADAPPADAPPSGCNAPSDCPGQDTECSKRTCVQGVCGTASLAAGLPVPLQIAGDCKVRQCDDKAQIVSVPDNFDVPEDGNPCTVDACSAGTPSHTKAPVSQACGGTNKCNAAGQCVGCNLAADCPGDDNVCQTRTCVSNVCGFNRVAAGTPIAAQTAGDCKVIQCDGQGHTTTVDDNNDKPVDGNACTSDVCSQGVPSNPPLPAGTTCGNGRTCDGDGRCSQCNVTADCGTSNECRTYTCTAQGTCQVAFTAAGTALTTQSAGDCKVAQCDGQGTTVQANDDTDTPADDGNPCTIESCVSGTPTETPADTSTTCNTNGGTHCDGAGMCVAAATAPTFMVLRVNAGSNLGTAVGAPLLIEERTLDNPSTVVRTITMPATVQLSGKANSEGWLSRSQDGHYLIAAGYTPVDATTKVVNSSAARVVARINAAGTVETYGVTSSAFVTDNLRGATSTDGTDIWAYGAGSSGSGGVWYLKFGSNAGAQVIGNGSGPKAPATVRACQIFSAKLYCDSTETDFAGVFTIGLGNAPTLGPQPANLLPGFSGASGPVPYQIAFAASDRFYLADDRAPPSGGVQRWTLQADTWVAGDNFNTGATGGRGALAITTGNTTTVLVTTAEVDASGNAGVNHILKFVDTGTGAPTASTIATAPDGSFFRGLALPAQ